MECGQAQCIQWLYKSKHIISLCFVSCFVHISFLWIFFSRSIVLPFLSLSPLPILSLLSLLSFLPIPSLLSPLPLFSTLSSSVLSIFHSNYFLPSLPLCMGSWGVWYPIMRWTFRVSLTIENAMVPKKEAWTCITSHNNYLADQQDRWDEVPGKYLLAAWFWSTSCYDTNVQPSGDTNHNLEWPLT